MLLQETFKEKKNKGRENTFECHIALVCFRLSTDIIFVQQSVEVTTTSPSCG